MRTIIYHEDEFCQLEILPLINKDFVIRQMNDIETFGNNKSNMGFDNIYIRQKNPIPTNTLKLTLNDLERFLENIPKFDIVETFYSSNTVECNNTYARGFHKNLAVLWETNNNDIVENIWLKLWITEQDKDKCCEILSTLGKVAPLLMADWELGFCVDLTSVQDINQYIKKVLINDL